MLSSHLEVLDLLVTETKPKCSRVTPKSIRLFGTAWTYIGQGLDELTPKEKDTGSEGLESNRHKMDCPYSKHDPIQLVPNGGPYHKLDSIQGDPAMTPNADEAIPIQELLRRLIELTEVDHLFDRNETAT